MNNINFNRPSPKKSLLQLLNNYYLSNIGIIILLILATVIINWRMINDGLNGKIDMIWHITWLQHFSAQVYEGIHYPRWLAGTNYGYGSPTFVFYPPLVYYLGTFLKSFGLNIEKTVIILYSSAIFFCGFNFYIYGRSRWGIIPSLAGAFTYMSAPYLTFTTYWVSSLSSLFAFAWIPLCFWLTEKTILQPRWGIGLTFFWAMLALTHLPSLLLFLVFWLFYTLFLLFNSSWKVFLLTLLCAAIGLGIVSFYLLPAVLEKSLVNIEVMKEIGGGFQVSMLGAANNPLMPLKLNSRPPHIFVHQSLAIVVLALITIVFFRRDIKATRETRWWFSFALGLAFFMSYLSWPIWQVVPILQSVQVSFRLLFIFSFVGAALYSVVIKGIINLQPKLKYPLLSIMILILTINFSFGYKLSRRFPTLNNPGKANLEHLAGVKTALEEPYTDKLRDVAEYIPLLSNGKSPDAPIIGQPRVSVIQGTATVEIQSWNSYQRLLKIDAEESSTIRIRTYFYPAWHLYLNEVSYPINVLSDGTIGFKLSPGYYVVKLNYQHTFAFIVGIIFSTISILLMIALWVIEFKFNLSKKII